MAEWQETQGTVVSASVHTGQMRYKMSSGGYGYKTGYSQEITYQYVVDGSTYVNNRFSRLASQTNRKGFVEQTVSKYPVGSVVTVYYDQNNPNDSYLEKGFGGDTNRMLMLILGGILLFSVVVFLALILIL